MGLYTQLKLKVDIEKPPDIIYPSTLFRTVKLDIMSCFSTARLLSCK